MRHTEPKVFLIGRSSTKDGEAIEWLRNIGVSDEGISRLMAGPKSGGERLVEAAGRRCYMSFEPGLNPNVTKIREDVFEYIDNILKVGHGSVLEHVYFTFAIENVSRVFTGEMNRHRAGMAISEGSMRYIRFEDIPYWIPTSIKDDPLDHERASSMIMVYSKKEEGYVRGEFEHNHITEVGLKKSKSRDVFERAFKHAEECYAELFEIWKDELAPESKFHAKKQITSMMRRIIPMGVSTGGVWTGNLRAWRHIFDMRCAEAAEEEIQLVAGLMLEKMVGVEPAFFRDFKKDEKGFWSSGYKKV